MGLMGEVVRWLGDVRGDDTLERRSAPAVQIFAIGLLVFMLVLIIAECLSPSSRQHGWLDYLVNGTSGVTLVAAVVCLWAIRHGRLRTGYQVLVGIVVATLVFSLTVRGLSYHREFLLRTHGVVVVLPALLLGRRALWLTAAAVGVGIVAGAARDSLFGVLPAPEPALGPIAQSVVVFALLTVIVDRLGMAAREAYASAVNRQRELETRTGELAESYERLKEETARRERTEAMLRESQKLEALGRLSGGIAHDFNNLLTAILGFAEIADQSLPSEHPVRKDLRQIREAGQSAASLVSQLLTFARRQVVKPRIVKIGEVIRRLEPMLRRVAGEDLQFVLDLPDDLAPVRIDPSQLEQVLVNLVVNARDAMPHGGRVEIGLESMQCPTIENAGYPELRPGKYMVIRVRDNGVGMDETTLKHIFEPFYTTKDTNRGTGLGLATCHGIVSQAGGAIAVESTLGSGTVFRVALPCADDGQEEVTTEAPARSRGGSETILLVEDDAQVRELAARILRDQGYRVLEAESQPSAMREAEMHRGDIDLVLTDVVLQDGDGAGLARSLSEKRPGIRTLFMSGYSHDVFARHGVRFEEQRVLQKPFTADQLAACVRDVLDLKVSRE